MFFHVGETVELVIYIGKDKRRGTTLLQSEKGFNRPIALVTGHSGSISRERGWREHRGNTFLLKLLLKEMKH
jgi:hypothetical protein